MNPNEVKVYKKYRLNRLGGSFNFNDKKLIMDNVIIPVSVAELSNEPIDSVVKYNERKRKRNEEDGEHIEKDTRPIAGSIYYEVDEDATKKYQELTKKRLSAIAENKVRKSTEAKQLLKDAFSDVVGMGGREIGFEGFVRLISEL